MAGESFAVRRTIVYEIVDELFIRGGDQTSVTHAFLRAKASIFDPVHLGCNYAALKTFLDCSCLADLQRRYPDYSEEVTALLDDRRDASIRNLMVRNWDEYAKFSPSGDPSTIFFEKLGTQALYERLRRPLHESVERRILFITDLSPLCAMAIAATSSRWNVEILRDFMQRYLIFRPYIHVSLAFGFALECHLPYYTLRKSDDSALDRRKIRTRTRFMPPGSNGKANNALYLHQAMISVIVFGIDEWVWTAICFTETYFKTEESVENYHQETTDAPSCADTPANKPIWNPREYFLMVLTRRIHQLTLEWYNVLAGFDRNMTLEIDADQSDKKEDISGYHKEAERLRKLDDALTNMIETWEAFAKVERLYFELHELNPRYTAWERYFGIIEQDLQELRGIRRSFQQKISLYDITMNNSEQEAAARSISRLTIIAIVFLPLQLAVSVFGMQMIPKSATFWHFSLVLVGLVVVTLGILYSNKLIARSIS